MSNPLIPLPRDDSLPGTLAEFVLEFSDEERCAALLRRWKYGEQGFRCPRCGGAMARVVDPRQRHIWYETCHGCNGSFFDAGEFLDLAELTLSEFFKGLVAPKR